MKEIHSKYEIVIFENKAAKTMLFIEFWRIMTDVDFKVLNYLIFLTLKKWIGHPKITANTNPIKT